MKTINLIILLFSIIYLSSCNSDKIKALSNENKSLRHQIIMQQGKIESLEYKINYLYKKDSLYQEQLIKLAQQDNKTLQLIELIITNY